MTAIDASIVDTIAPSWFEALNLLKQDFLLGKDLRNKIDSVLAGNYDNTCNRAERVAEAIQFNFKDSPGSTKYSCWLGSA